MGYLVVQFIKRLLVRLNNPIDDVHKTDVLDNFTKQSLKKGKPTKINPWAVLICTVVFIYWACDEVNLILKYLERFF